MKILITGSHFTPAQAVIEQLKKRSVEIVYIGRRYTLEGDKTPSVESGVLPSLQVKFIPVTTGRLQRSFTIHTIPSLLKIPWGIIQSFLILWQEKPDVVLSFGGYVAVPVVFSAWLLSIPIIIHEQTLISGLANTISSWFASKVAVSFYENTSFNSKTIVTGNPLRKEVLQKDPKKVDPEILDIINLSKKENLPLILITGGNQGSHIINQAVEEVLEELSKKAFIIHQTGDSKFQDYERLIKKQRTLKLPQRYLVKKWIKGWDIGFIFKEANLAVSRAGINTLLELAFFAVPSLVIPLPYLYKDEQNVNAKFFENRGLVKILAQKDLTGKNLFQNIGLMISELDNLKRKAQEAKRLVIPDAASRLALETILLAKSQ